MKKTMMITILILTAIIIVSSFGLQLTPVDVKAEIPSELAANILYICPTASSNWDALATGFRPFSKGFTVLLAASMIVLAFSWGWAIYQNLLKDKFDADKYKTPWGMTKVIFWGAVIVYMLIMTPNYFKTVHINGVETDYVLCEVGDKDALPVRADIVSH